MPADIPSSLASWFVNAALNPPSGSTLILGNLDDNLRAIVGGVRQLAAQNTIAASASLNLASVDEAFLSVTGSGFSISALGTVSAGMPKVLVFGGNNTVVHGANLECPGGMSLQVQNGDVLWLMSRGAGSWKVLGFWPKSGGYPAGQSMNTLGTTGAQSVDVSLSENHRVSPTGALTLTFINPKPTGSVSVFSLVVKMGATPFGITWPASVRWPGGSVPALSGANKTDMFGFWTDDGGVTWYGAQTGKGW
jgi:hypothetical protein